MSFIEGVGDEVTAFFVIVIVIVLAALVTFMGSGSHLYSITPTHIPVLPTQPETITQQVPEPLVTRTENSESNGTTQPNPADAIRWPSTDNRYYEEVGADSRQVDDTSDDTTEEQSSSDDNNRVFNDIEGRQTESCPSNSNSTAPTAPAEEILAEESEQTVEPPNLTSQEIRVRLKYLDDTERTVVSNPTAKVVDFKRKHFPEDLANNKIVRLIFCGHLLRDSSTLESYRVLDNSVIHVQILQAQTEQTRPSVSQNTDLDLSHLLWPLVSIVLGICWIFYFKYPEFFSMLSVGLLLLFTGSFVFFYSSHMHG